MSECQKADVKTNIRNGLLRSAVQGHISLPFKSTSASSYRKVTRVLARGDFRGAFSVAATGECFSAVELCGADASADRKSSQDGPRIRIHDNELLRIAADILSHYEEERHPSHAPAKLVLTIETKSVAAIPPASWASKNETTSAKRIPANVLLSDQAMVTPGFANDVEAVNQ